MSEEQGFEVLMKAMSEEFIKTHWLPALDEIHRENQELRETIKQGFERISQYDEQALKRQGVLEFKERVLKGELLEEDCPILDEIGQDILRRLEERGYKIVPPGGEEVEEEEPEAVPQGQGLSLLIYGKDEPHPEDAVYVPELGRYVKLVNE